MQKKSLNDLVERLSEKQNAMQSFQVPAEGAEALCNLMHACLTQSLCRYFQINFEQLANS